MKRTVYRVEHKTSRTGPYRSRLLPKAVRPFAQRIAEESDIWSRHPTPSQDGLDYMEDDEYCAFATLESLLQWFRNWAEELDQNGFRIKVFNVPAEEVKVGGHQVLFKRKGRRAVKTLQFSEVY